jgi:hypothetical protein
MQLLDEPPEHGPTWLAWQVGSQIQRDHALGMGNAGRLAHHGTTSALMVPRRAPKSRSASRAPMNPPALSTLQGSVERKRYRTKCPATDSTSSNEEVHIARRSGISNHAHSSAYLPRLFRTRPMIPAPAAAITATASHCDEVIPLNMPSPPARGSSAACWNASACLPLIVPRPRVLRASR